MYKSIYLMRRIRGYSKNKRKRNELFEKRPIRKLIVVNSAIKNSYIRSRAHYSLHGNSEAVDKLTVTTWKKWM